MFSRRRFVRQSLFGLTLPTLAPRLTDSAGPRPVVISTWDDGKISNAAAWSVLRANGHALDAVEAAGRAAEDIQGCCIGLTGYPDRDGHVTLDACLMDDRFRCGSVVFLEHIKHPVSVARKLMETTPHVMLAGEGALQFALANGFVREPDRLSADAQNAWKTWLKTADYKPVVNIENAPRTQPPTPNRLPNGAVNHDTMGTIAMDASGRLSGACTTSGMAFKMRGRVGDSPIIGAGLYIDNEVGAAVGTGQGEEVIRMAGTHFIIEAMQAGASPEAACRRAIERIVKYTPNDPKAFQVAFIALSKTGDIGAFAVQPGFSYAISDSDAPSRIVKAASHFS